MTNYIIEALDLLKDDDIEIIDKRPKPKDIQLYKKEGQVVDNSLNARLLSKINEISKALAISLEKENLGKDIDPELIKQDMIRDCGLMGDIISTDDLDVEHNPFDAATKQMHDMGPIDKNIACSTLLNVPIDEFVSRIIMGLKSERGVLPGPRIRASLPHNNIRRLR